MSLPELRQQARVSSEATKMFDLIKLSIRARIEDFDAFFNTYFYDDRVSFFEKQKYRLRKLLFESESHEANEAQDLGQELRINIISESPMSEGPEPKVFRKDFIAEAKINSSKPIESSKEVNKNGKDRGNTAKKKKVFEEAPKSARLAPASSKKEPPQVEQKTIYSVAMNQQDYDQFIEFKKQQEPEVKPLAKSYVEHKAVVRNGQQNAISDKDARLAKSNNKEPKKEGVLNKFRK